VERTTLLLALVIFGSIAILYFLRPVILPVVLAAIVAMSLKPTVRWLSKGMPPPLATGVVLAALVAAFTAGFIQLGRPALQWLNEGPEHVAELKKRTQKMFPRIARFIQAASAVNSLGESQSERDPAKPPPVEIKDSRAPGIIINWTGNALVGLGETLVLLYLLLASGDFFLLKLVRVMPTLANKKAAVEISHEIQQSISRYLVSVSLINICLGLVAGGGFYFARVPNPAMWGMLVALLNYIPYFGPIAGILLMTMLGLLTFDNLAEGLLPAAWYLVLHLAEANFVTPVLIGRRFRLSPAVIFVSLIFWTWLWGVPGALLSVPILLLAKVVCDYVPALSFVAELLTDSPKTAN
jgi:predicted PurR-regulated permease PerM